MGPKRQQPVKGSPPVTGLEDGRRGQGPGNVVSCGSERAKKPILRSPERGSPANASMSAQQAPSQTAASRPVRPVCADPLGP